MTFLDSLLDAIIRLDGDALVMHVGEKPYVTTSAIGGAYRGPLSWGQVELSSRPLTVDAVLGMLTQILPPDLLRSLSDIGAIEHEIPSPGGGEPFIVTAARGGDDIWVEVRRRPVIPERQAVPEPVASPVAEAPADQPEQVAEPVAEQVPEQVPEPVAEPIAEQEPEPLADVVPEPAGEPEAEPLPVPLAVEDLEQPIEFEEPVEFETPVPLPIPISIVEDEPVSQAEAAGEVFTLDGSFDDVPHFEIVGEEEEAPAVQAAEAPSRVVTPAEPPEEWNELSLPDRGAQPPLSTPAAAASAQDAAVVLPLARPALKLQPPPPHADASDPAPAPPVLLEILKTAAARGAATAYAVAGSRPFVRVEGEVVELGMEPAVTVGDIERFTFALAPRNDQGEAASEWVFALPEVGRVHAVSFADESGPGLVLHIAANVSTAEQIGLPHEAQKLCTEADGLVLVTGPRRNGKSTLLGAFVDLINRRRTDYVVTIESRIKALHERRHALISQREVDGDGEAIARAARAALREGPDVLVLDDIRAPEAVAVALDAARSGRLVIAAIAAPSAAGAIERLIDGFPTDRRPQVRALLASSLRGVVSQVLVEKKGGGRIAAREVLLGTPAVAKLVLDGATAQLGVAMESAARAGMRTLPQALAGLVRDGLVEAEEAYRHVPDQRAFLTMLQRESIEIESERRA